MFVPCLKAVTPKPILVSPSSLLPVMSKCLEKIVHEQLNEYFDECPRAGKPIIAHEQFACGALHGCENALALAITQ